MIDSSVSFNEKNWGIFINLYKRINYILYINMLSIEYNLMQGVQYPKDESEESTFISSAVNAKIGSKLFWSITNVYPSFTWIMLRRCCYPTKNINNAQNKTIKRKMGAKRATILIILLRITTISFQWLWSRISKE